MKKERKEGRKSRHWKLENNEIITTTKLKDNNHHFNHEKKEMTLGTDVEKEDDFAINYQNESSIILTDLLRNISLHFFSLFCIFASGLQTLF